MWTFWKDVVGWGGKKRDVSGSLFYLRFFLDHVFRVEDTIFS